MVTSELRTESDENALPDDQAASASIRALLLQGQTILGIELGSTRIKACLIGSANVPIAAGGAEWENELVAGVWTYSLDADAESGNAIRTTDNSPLAPLRPGLT